MSTEPKFLVCCDVEKSKRKNNFAVCPLCFAQNINPSHQQIHLKSECPFPTKKYYSDDCSKYFCADCDQGFVTEYEVDYHQAHHCWDIFSPSKNHCKKAKRNGNCTKCLKKDILKLKTFICTKCEKGFSTYSEKEAHQYNKTKKNRFLQKQKCEKKVIYVFENENLKQDAEKEDHVPALFYCKNCYQKFFKRKWYAEHDCCYKHRPNF